MKLAGKLYKVVGIIIGSIVNVKCEELDYILWRWYLIGDLNRPIIYNVQTEIIPNPILLPIGALINIETDKIAILEPMFKE